MCCLRVKLSATGLAALLAQSYCQPQSHIVLPAGRGALTLGTLRPLPTEPLHIPPLCLGAADVAEAGRWRVLLLLCDCWPVPAACQPGAAASCTTLNQSCALPLCAAGRLPEQNNAVVNLDFTGASPAPGTLGGWGSS